MNAPVTFAPYGIGGGLLATAGIAALDPETLTPLHPHFAEQADWVLDRLDAVLEAAGADRRNIVRLECFLADRGWFDRWNTRFARHFGDHPPARTTLVCGLPVAGLLIEVQALVAITPDPGGRPS